MMGRRVSGALGTLLGCACLAFAAPASGQDERAGLNDFGGFRNVLPGGQGETIDAGQLAAAQAGGPPESFTDQLPLYTDLLEASPRLSAADLNAHFKDAGFGVTSSEVASTVSPRAGVTIVRDRTWGVPHVYGVTREDTFFGAGYASATDRLFAMDVLRHFARGRLSEFAGPGKRDENLLYDLDQLKLADYTEPELQRMLDESTRRAGAEGAVIRRDFDAYVAGVNAYIAEARTDPRKMPGEYAALGEPLEDWKPTDSVAVASLVGGIFGKGGGFEALNAEALAAARQRFGPRRARRVYEDFRAREDPEAPATLRVRVPARSTGRADSQAIATLDAGSYRRVKPDVEGGSPPGEASAAPTGRAGSSEAGVPSGTADPAATVDLSWLHGVGGPRGRDMSNSLLVDARHSRSGRPLAVMGPQVGYYSPQILMEMDLHGPGIDARGATFPGISLYVLIGRGPDFAWSATTATTDNVDQFAEPLCEPDGSRPTLASKHHLYRGRCVPLTRREHVIEVAPTAADIAAGRRQDRTVTVHLERSVHGPVQGHATVGGAPVAIASARSTYMHEVDSTLAFKRLNGDVRSASDFQQAIANVNFAFNWFYADDRDIAYQHSGWYPLRARGTDPSLVTWGTGEWDWVGYDPATFESRVLASRAQPRTINPAGGYLANWNNKPAPGWSAADDQWAYSSVHRNDLLEKPVRAAVRAGAKTDMTRLVQVMEEAATQDVRGVESYPWIRRVIGRAGDPSLESMLALLDRWSAAGAHRRDLDGDNLYEDGAAVALMDAWWPGLVYGAFEPVLGRPLIERILALSLGFGNHPSTVLSTEGSAFSRGWWGYLDKDLRALLGKRVRGPLSRRYCGRGSRRRCRNALLSSLRTAVTDLEKRYGGGPEKWVVPATCALDLRPPACDQIEFTTLGGAATPPIPWQNRPTFQQLVEVEGHRPR